jgi:hypothetical protein
VLINFSFATLYLVPCSDAPPPFATDNHARFKSNSNSSSSNNNNGSSNHGSNGNSNSTGGQLTIASLASEVEQLKRQYQDLWQLQRQTMYFISHLMKQQSAGSQAAAQNSQPLALMPPPDLSIFDATFSPQPASKPAASKRKSDVSAKSRSTRSRTSGAASSSSSSSSSSSVNKMNPVADELTLDAEEEDEEELDDEELDDDDDADGAGGHVAVTLNPRGPIGGGKRGANGSSSASGSLSLDDDGVSLGVSGAHDELDDELDDDYEYGENEDDALVPEDEGFDFPIVAASSSASKLANAFVAPSPGHVASSFLADDQPSSASASGGVRPPSIGIPATPPHYSVVGDSTLVLPPPFEHLLRSSNVNMQQVQAHLGQLSRNLSDLQASTPTAALSLGSSSSSADSFSSASAPLLAIASPVALSSSTSVPASASSSSTMLPPPPLPMNQTPSSASGGALLPASVPVSPAAGVGVEQHQKLFQMWSHAAHAFSSV